MGSASASVSTFSLSNLSYIKSGKRKRNEKEIISSTLASSSSSKKISPRNQTPKNKVCIEKDKDLNDDEANTLTRTKRKISTKQQQYESKKKNELGSDGEEIKENSQLNNLDEYNSHILPLIIGDTVHILEENGEGKMNYKSLIHKIYY